MSSRTLLNLVLLGIVIALIAVAVYEPGKAPTPALPKLTALTPADITRIRIERYDDAHIKLEKQEGIWYLREPVVLPASEFLVNTILRISEADSHAQYPMSELDLAQTGLAEPKVILYLNGLRIEYGKTEPLNHRRYLRIGDTVHLVLDTTYPHLRSEATNLIDTALLPPGSELHALHLPEGKVSKQEGTWIVAPTQPELSADAMQQWLDEWRHARAIQVKAYSGDMLKPEISVYLEGDQAPLRFDITRGDDTLILGRSDLGVEYHMVESVGKKLIALPQPAGAERLGDAPPPTE